MNSDNPYDGLSDKVKSRIDMRLFGVSLEQIGLSESPPVSRQAVAQSLSRAEKAIGGLRGVLYHYRKGCTR